MHAPHEYHPIHELSVTGHKLAVASFKAMHVHVKSHFAACEKLKFPERERQREVERENKKKRLKENYTNETEI